VGGAAFRQKEKELIEEMRSLATLKRTAKQCPACRMAIEKSAGCNKMHCTVRST
jgi:E3 ubiquitin-protein ligase RNF14